MNTKKKTLIKLAHDKGFRSQIFTDTEWLYSSKEDLRYYLWMCELDLWVNRGSAFYMDGVAELEKILTTYLKNN